MLDESVLNLSDNDTDLYKYAFPLNLSHPTLAIVGHVQAIGSVIPIAEMQARWITRIFSGKPFFIFCMGSGSSIPGFSKIKNNLFFTPHLSRNIQIFQTFLLLLDKCKLPSKEEMLEDINTKRKAMAKQYVESRRHKLQVN